MKHIFQFLFFVFVLQAAHGQKSVHPDESISADFSSFPNSEIKFWTRTRNPFSASEIGVFENGVKVSQIGVKDIDSLYRPVSKNKYVLILIQNHYQNKGRLQRDYFKNLLSQGLADRINKGDKYLVATFDWYRNGQYLFFPGGSNFTDDVEKIFESISSINAPSNLGNKQEGSDIYNALDEALKTFNNIKDTLPKNILLLSDDFPNIVSNVQPSAIAEKSLQMDIPIYCISHNMGYSRYNRVMKNQISELSNGDYFLSENNDPYESGKILAGFIDNMNKNSLGLFRQISYKSNLTKAGGQIPIKVELKDYPVREFEVSYPFNLFDWIKAKPLLFVVYLLSFILVIFLFVYLINQFKKRKKLALEKEKDLLEKQARSNNEIQLLQNQQNQLTAKYEEEKTSLKKKLNDENLRRNLDLLGLSSQLIYTYESKSTVIPMKDIYFTVGRMPSNNLCLDLPFISKMHLKIEFQEDGKFYVTDLNSTNGTLLNNKKLNGTGILNNGDVISIGKVDIKFSQINAR